MDYTPLDRPESIPIVFVEAWNNRDPDKLASIFDEDAEFVNVTGLWWHNRESIRKAHAYGLERIFNQSLLQLTTVKVKWLSDEIAVVHARMSLSGQTPVGSIVKPGTRTTIFSFVGHRGVDIWRCASAQNTDIVPNMETNVIDDDGQFRSANYRHGGSTP
jgi:uncharacterized protein (TIGR02246 family)